VEKNKILNIDILSVSLSDLLNSLNGGIIFTPNVDHLVKLQKDKDFFEAYKIADWVICDSKIVSICAKFLGSPFKEVIPGSSLLPAYYNFHKNNREVRIFLLGAASGVAHQAKDNINKNVGWNMVVDAHSPSFGFEKDTEECLEIVNKINRSKANVLVVGLGAPKQEKWIFKHHKLLTNVKLVMALGATIDFEAGNVKRAPRLFQRLHAEWFFRLVKEPKRLFRRYLIEDVSFFYYVIKQKIGKYHSPF
jgi:N-acetylglucosaminyldiphosphoundecaprenol N-acetyl-beta-D-mannosaminyltransferase